MAGGPPEWRTSGMAGRYRFVDDCDDLLLCLVYVLRVAVGFWSQEQVELCGVVSIRAQTAECCVGASRSPYTTSLRADDEGRYQCHAKVNVSAVKSPASQSLQLIVHCVYLHSLHQYCDRL